MNISWSDCDVQQKVDCVRQLVMTNSGVGPRRSSKALPKENLHQKKVMFTVWWPAAHLTHYSFLNFNETITSEKYAQQINEMHWKLQCLQLALVNRMSPTILHNNAQPHIAQPTLQKLNESGYEALVSSPIFTWTLANWLPLLQASQQLFAEKTLPKQAGWGKCFPRGH